MDDKTILPKHIAIIMDGNGRWAKQRGLPRSAGHRAGIGQVKAILNAARELGIEVITFFAFSTENWSRPKKEVDMLMRSLNNFLEREIKGLHKNNIKLRIIGGGDPIPDYLQRKIKEAEEKTKDNTGLVVLLALNYGSRQEIVEAVKKVVDAVLAKRIEPQDLDVDIFGSYLYTAGLPDPDLLIRTSGEMRISNFLLWQLSYAELYFPEKHWPDFGRKDLEKAIEVYQQRERRYGGISAE